MNQGARRAFLSTFSVVVCCGVGGTACQNKPAESASSPPVRENVTVRDTDVDDTREGGGAGAPRPAVRATSAATDGSTPSAIPSHSSQVLPTGQPCRVHLRRDALGLSAVAPLSIQHVSPAARATWLEGTIEHATDQWVVIHSAGRPYWIRADVILAVELLEEQ